jgi:hypothetical protein
VESLDYLYKKFNVGPTFSKRQKYPIPIDNFNRIDLAKLFNELGFKIGVEVGVERGRYSGILCKEIPGVTLYGVDPWETYDGYIDYKDQQQLSDFREIAMERLKGFPNFIPIKEYSVQASKRFKDDSLDFVYLDGNHMLQAVIEDLNIWIPKLRVGGIISGHDYVPRWKSSKRCIQVIEAVKAYTAANDIGPWFVTQGGNMAITRHASFFWVKQ